MNTENNEDQKPSANEMQIAGTHYRAEVQHWDFAAANYGPGYFKGNATKYLTRWRKKNGLEDLKKARHYVQKMCETDWGSLGYRLDARHAITVVDLCAANGVPDADRHIIEKLSHATSHEDLEAVLAELDEFIAQGGALV